MSIKLFIIISLFLLCGCVILKDPKPEDTRFDESQRDWLEVYRSEIKAAVENEDEAAYHFFFQEYMRERIRQVRAAKKKK